MTMLQQLGLKPRCCAAALLHLRADETGASIPAQPGSFQTNKQGAPPECGTCRSLRAPAAARCCAPPPAQAGEPYPLLGRLPRQSIRSVRGMGLAMPSPQRPAPASSPPSPPPQPPPQPLQAQPPAERPAPPVYGYGTVRGGGWGGTPQPGGADASLAAHDQAISTQWMLAALASQQQGLAHLGGYAGAEPYPDPGQGYDSRAAPAGLPVGYAVGVPHIHSAGSEPGAAAIAAEPAHGAQLAAQREDAYGGAAAFAPSAEALADGEDIGVGSDGGARGCTLE